MAILTDAASAWEAGVYQLEVTDPVQGGAPNTATMQGVDNIPHLQLARRTQWLKAQLEAAQNGAGYRTALTITAGQTLTAADMGECVIFSGSAAATVTLPALSTVPTGSAIEIVNTGTADLKVQRAGTDQIDSGPSAVVSIVIPPNQSLKLVRASGSTLWCAIGISATLIISAASRALLAATDLAGMGAVVGALGVGQTIQSPARTAGVTYTNTTGRPIAVYARAQGPSGSLGAGMVLFVDGLVCGAVTLATLNGGVYAGFTGSTNAVVPSGSTYRVELDNASLLSWTELRS
jgi:hypothetical protein